MVLKMMSTKQTHKSTQHVSDDEKFVTTTEYSAERHSAVEMKSFTDEGI
jgi:hypothetical protein